MKTKNKAGNQETVEMKTNSKEISGFSILHFDFCLLNSEFKSFILTTEF